MSKDEYKFVLCQDSTDPDPELLVWEKWIKIRQEETEHLAMKTGRTTAQLVMNLCECIREKNEEKVVLEHAQIEKKPKVRGAFWAQPERLKQKCYCKPVYELHRTRAEMGYPRIIQHIGAPHHIQETEKGISGSQRKTFTKLDSEFGNYKNQRESELAVSMKKIDPYRPKLSELIIIGSKPKPPPQKILPLPSIEFSLNYDTPEDDEREVLCAVYAIRINNTVLFKEIPSQTLDHLKMVQKESWHEQCESWSYYFNCPINRMGRSKFNLQNLGTVTLRYCWRKTKPLDVNDLQDPVFFFSKNENVICPGQSQELKITFISNAPGTYFESWELTFLNICFFDSIDNQLILNLYADSVENVTKIRRKTQTLENIIYTKVLKNIARDLIEEVLVKATIIQPQVYPYEKVFLEADLFVMKNPICFYHQTEVMKLKDMYREMSPDEVWDLSISGWRTAMMAKEFDDRMKYYEILKKSHRECLKPWYEGIDLFTQKHKAVNQILEQWVNKFDEECDRIPELFYNMRQKQKGSSSSHQEKLLRYSSSSVVRHMFYLRIYEHFANAVELCAGVLSSLDLNRWITFDFCRT